jgi:D-serine deaminase-like pyridoxal phosphate-dependent protein
LLANLLVDPAAIRWIASHVLGGEDTGFSCYVESVASVELLDRECGKAGPAGRLDVLLEVGYLGGRTGVRRLEESLGVARAVNQSEHLRLIGVAGYEGRMPGAATGEPAGLDVYLESIAQTARQLNAGACSRPAGCQWSPPVVAPTSTGSSRVSVLTVSTSRCRPCCGAAVT